MYYCKCGNRALTFSDLCQQCHNEKSGCNSRRSGGGVRSSVVKKSKSMKKSRLMISPRRLYEKYVLENETNEDRRLILRIKYKYDCTFDDIGNRFNPPITKQSVSHWYLVGQIPKDRVSRLKFLLNHWNDQE
jgi:hypothetical protein